MNPRIVAYPDLSSSSRRQRTLPRAAVLVGIGWLGLAGCDGVAEAPPGNPSSGVVTFRPTVQQDLENTNCTSCHDGAAPMNVKGQPQSDADWLANFREVRSRCGSPTASVLITKSLGEGGHPKLLNQDSPVIARLRGWISAGMPYTSSARPDAGPGPGPSTVTWNGNVKSLLAAKCVGCHGQSSPRGAYSLNSYAGALSNGSDGVPNVVPGNTDSTLATYCKNGHFISGADAALVVSWIVDWNARED